MLTAKDLEKYPYLVAKIKRLRNEISDLRRTNDLPTAVMGSRLELPYDIHEIPIGAEHITFQIACDIQLKKSELECAIGEVKDIDAFMSSIQDIKIHEILYQKYILGQTWKDVATCLKLNETEDSVKKKAQRFFKFCPECPTCHETAV